MLPERVDNKPKFRMSHLRAGEVEREDGGLPLVIALTLPGIGHSIGLVTTCTPISITSIKHGHQGSDTPKQSEKQMIIVMLCT